MVSKPTGQSLMKGPDSEGFLSFFFFFVVGEYHVSWTFLVLISFSFMGIQKYYVRRKHTFFFFSVEGFWTGFRQSSLNKHA